MSTEYTLPPVPDHPEPYHMRWSELERKAIADYGLICSYKAREPLIEETARLLARIAELEAVLSDWRQVRSAVAEIAGHDPNWPDHGNAPLAITASYALRKQESDRLRAEVEALTVANAALVASNDAMREDAERYIHLKSIAKVGITKRQEFVITLDLVPCPGHIGMLDLALDAARAAREEG